MAFIAAVRTNKFFAHGCLAVCIALAGLWGQVASAQQTTVGATICAASSTITLAAPQGDSITNEAEVPLGGTVSQSNQIEVYVDEVLDHVIPLSIGQVTYSGAVQLTQGTHAITVKALTICPGPDATATAVVTYAPPPGAGSSSGEDVPTKVDEQQGGVIIGGEGVAPSSSTPLFPKIAGIGVEEVLQWLTIETKHKNEDESLSYWRAGIVTAGLYLVVIGIATQVVQWVATLPVVIAATPFAPANKRTKWFGWGFRGLGVLLLLGAVFL